MNAWMMGLGIVLVGIAMLDALATTLLTSGGGPLTNRISEALWTVFLGLHRLHGAFRHRVLHAGGMILLLVIFAVWIGLLWAGWTIIFSADPLSVVDRQTGEPVDTWGRIYFTGYTIFTLGIGNYVPRGGGWEVATALASINGLFLITMAITYFVPVISAVVQMRQIAATISDYGSSPEEIVRTAWDGASFEGFRSTLQDLVPLIELHNQRHLAYPVLHYFHSPDRRAAIGPAIAALDEALLLLSAGVEEDVRLPVTVLTPIRRAVRGFLSTFSQHYDRALREPPPAPALFRLRHGGIPTVADRTFCRAVQSADEHRQRLRAFVEDDGWTWEDVGGAG